MASFLRPICTCTTLLTPSVCSLVLTDIPRRNLYDEGEKALLLSIQSIDPIPPAHLDTLALYENINEIAGPPIWPGSTLRLRTSTVVATAQSLRRGCVPRLGRYVFWGLI
jgi:hypothetical protein